MIWLVACVLFAMAEEAAVYDETDDDDDFDEAYVEDDCFTSPMTVAKEYSRRRRSDVTIALKQLGTRNEYEDAEADTAVKILTVLPLTMLPIYLGPPKRTSEANTNSLGSPMRSIILNNISNIYPKSLRSSNSNKGNGNIINYSRRFPKLKSDLTAYLEPRRFINLRNYNTAFLNLPIRSSKPISLLPVIPGAPKTSITQNDLTIYPDIPAMSTNPNTDLSAYIKYPTQSSTSISTNTDTTTDIASTMSTFTDVFYSNISTSNSLMFLKPVGVLTPFVYRTECVDCDNSTLDSLRENKVLELFATQPTLPIATPRPQLNVPFLLKLIDNLTLQYDWNLTKRFNESLQKYEIATCPTWTTVVPTTDNFGNASVVSKCFVCGLKARGVPYNSRCADAFSGDFIPLVPVDAQARGSISRYRKYCRYLDVNGVVESPFEPRSVFGRFTGGCSVRWVDVTSIYTQRSCRNRRRAVLGNHFGSKRMAKLEMALQDVDDGCIISPVATLLPLSRGISLYARFHACVCTGSWCNRAVQIPTWTSNFTLLLMLMTLNILS